MLDRQQTGIVFNVQKFSVHDGEGIRTLVFLKGCPLHCPWCSNPESQRREPERAYNPTRCLTAAVCGRCAKACPTGALSIVGGLVCFDRSKCTGCNACVRACPSGAQTVYGETQSVDQILSRVEEDGVFYTRSGGGLTLSGGEALAQPDFALALLREAKKRHIHTTIETCGHYPTDVLDQACRVLDALIFDIKCLDSARHKKATGVGSELILKNIGHVFEHFPDLPVLIRTPVIPGFNDTEEDILGIREMIPRKANIRYEALTYHRMGQPKYGYLGRRHDHHRQDAGRESGRAEGERLLRALPAAAGRGECPLRHQADPRRHHPPGFRPHRHRRQHRHPEGQPCPGGRGH